MRILSPQIHGMHIQKRRTSLLAGVGFPCTVMTVLFVFALSGCEKETSTGIAFNHEQHLSRGFSCGLCHLSQSDNEPRRPPERVCAFCHELGDHAQPDAQCALCHTRVDFTSGGTARPTFADSKFTHEAHIRAGVDCQACHVNQVHAKVYEDIVIPPMKDCLACHARTGAPQKCEACHETWREDIKPTNHDHRWLENHGRLAITDFESNCDYCHQQKDFCQDCHMANPPRSHTRFFRNRGHGFEVSTNRLSCEPCHQQDFCLRCHDVEQGVKPASHTAAFTSRRPYLHCAGCHFPDGAANGCNACHSAGAIHEAHWEAMDARNVPNVPEFVIQFSRSCLEGCHPYSVKPPHHPLSTLTNSECLICHLR